MSQAPDQALRRMVRELARLRASDLSAVLEMLDPPQRLRVSQLLQDLARPTRSSDFDPAPDSAGLSPWLASRVKNGTGMTFDAVAALRACVTESAPPLSSTAVAQAPTLIGRVTHGLGFRERRT